jgi:serine/threonine protein kinase
MHSKKLIHRDIKPENIVVVHVIEFLKLGNRKIM